MSGWLTTPSIPFQLAGDLRPPLLALQPSRCMNSGMTNTFRDVEKPIGNVAHVALLGARAGVADPLGALRTGIMPAGGHRPPS